MVHIIRTALLQRLPRSKILPNQTAYLTEIAYLSKTRQAVIQDFAGGTLDEISIYLRKRGFDQDEVQDLFEGFIIDNRTDKRKQFRLDTQVLKSTYSRDQQIKMKPQPPPTAPTPPKEAPVAKTTTKAWNDKVRDYREAANKTQTDIMKVLGMTSNLVSTVETGKRFFTVGERALFFRHIGLPEDPTIPVMSPEQEERAARAKGRAPRGPKKPAKAAKALQSPAAASTPTAPKKAAKSAAKAKHKGPKKVTLPPSAPPLAIPSKMKPGPKPGAKKAAETKLAETIAAPVAQPVSPEAAPVYDLVLATGETPLSPVKSGILADIKTVIGHRDLSDAQAVRLHNLFKSLTVQMIFGG